MVMSHLMVMNPSKIRHKILLDDHLPQTYQIHNCSWRKTQNCQFFSTMKMKKTLIPGDFKEIPGIHVLCEGGFEDPSNSSQLASWIPN